MEKNTPKKTQDAKREKNYDLAGEIMPKGERVEASLMHKNRFQSKSLH